MGEFSLSLSLSLFSFTRLPGYSFACPFIFVTIFIADKNVFVSLFICERQGK